MFPLTRIPSLAATGAFVAFTAVSTQAPAYEFIDNLEPVSPSLNYEFIDNLGPVSPSEPILAPVGGKRIIAFYQPDHGNCAVRLVVWNPTDESSAEFEVTLSPRQMGHIEGGKNESTHLQCGDRAERLAFIDTSKCIKFVPTRNPSW